MVGHPSSLRVSRWAASSTPSATTLSPSPVATLMIGPDDPASRPAGAEVVDEGLVDLEFVDRAEPG